MRNSDLEMQFINTRNMIRTMSRSKIEMAKSPSNKSMKALKTMDNRAPPLTCKKVKSISIVEAPAVKGPISRAEMKKQARNSVQPITETTDVKSARKSTRMHLVSNPDDKKLTDLLTKIKHKRSKRSPKAANPYISLGEVNDFERISKLLSSEGKSTE
jgi:hypothetical protein